MGRDHPRAGIVGNSHTTGAPHDSENTAWTPTTIHKDGGYHERIENWQVSQAWASFWSDADWIYCRDEKYRPVEPGTFPLAHGIPDRVGRLRAYGNAIVPQVAAEVIKAYLDATS
jgi:hypothetical protein